MSYQAAMIAVACLLGGFFAFATAQSQAIVNQQLQQYDSNKPPQHTGEHISGRRFKRMYAMCPPHFVRIGNECYFISEDRDNWLEAHFKCKDRNSKLAEPLKYDDKNLRKFLQSKKEKNYIWIGGNYNWRANKWQWGYNGKDIGYQSFSQMVPGSSQDLKYHCAVLNPDLKFRWSAKLCTEKLNFICQHKMPFVNSHSRSKVYTRWNETFPNEKANEFEVVVADQPRSSKQRDYYRTTNNTTSTNLYNRIKNKKLYRAHRNRVALHRNDYISNDIIRRPVVEYAEDRSQNSINGNGNGYSNGNGGFSRSFKVDFYHQKKVNRGENYRHQHRHHTVAPYVRPSTAAPTPTTPAATTTVKTTVAPQTLPTEALQVATESYPPNRPEEDRKSHRDRIRDRLAQLTPEQRRQFMAKHITTTEKYQLSYEEKKNRRDKLRERLGKLTPDERDKFFAERAKRRQAKSFRDKNETIP